MTRRWRPGAAGALMALLALAQASSAAGYPDVVAFEGSAFLMGWYAGVAQVLLEKKVLVPGVTRSAGLSGGAYTLALAHLNYTGAQINGLWQYMFGRNVSIPRMVQGGVNALAEPALDQYLPDDISPVQGVMHIALSQLNANRASLNDSASWVINRWDNKVDLKSCLLGTNAIPCFGTAGMFSIFRNQPVIDGGYGNGFPELCLDAANKDCFKAGSWVVGPLANHTCDPVKCGKVLYEANCTVAKRTVLRHSLYKNTQTYVDRWKLWKIKDRCPTTAWGNNTPPNPTPAFVPQGLVTPDLYPGLYNPLPRWPKDAAEPMLACEWQNYAMAPPFHQIKDFLEMCYDLGMRDAEAWHAANAARLGR
ncbi:hypothetical protein HT031_000889 [Scenedesmus sp. PABB004]|nr:hypothetical protein HT031_000889 [Scenedesmus sp. PABB004]